ncbi:hypothetical protein FIBSPDRAFT_558971 [Athelia psychrophila]|uniref:Uncharacterized protein n=1 Tax=Athelia psychrophila TaxID=1759441 RepID=A0A167VF46_9AGAM|nr:hypothetical protein FIBSPDRAFT_371055 [Fibularhizoctonia sp. CBS 109695]KZP19778.1 hypothetical protein FIBSPDRAFT_558971 [Fibularhizoctonia sp. CBS 109695]
MLMAPAIIHESTKTNFGRGRQSRNTVRLTPRAVATQTFYSIYDWRHSDPLTSHVTGYNRLEATRLTAIMLNYRLPTSSQCMLKPRSHQ